MGVAFLTALGSAIIARGENQRTAENPRRFNASTLVNSVVMFLFVILVISANEPTDDKPPIPSELKPTIPSPIMVQVEQEAIEPLTTSIQELATQAELNMEQQTRLIDIVTETGQITPSDLSRIGLNDIQYNQMLNFLEARQFTTEADIHVVLTRVTTNEFAHATMTREAGAI